MVVSSPYGLRINKGGIIMGYSIDDLSTELQKRTAYDDIVVGCFLTNYGIPGRCSAFRGYCKDGGRCKRLDRVLAKMYENGVRYEPNSGN